MLIHSCFVYVHLLKSIMYIHVHNLKENFIINLVDLAVQVKAGQWTKMLMISRKNMYNVNLSNYLR